MRNAPAAPRKCLGGVEHGFVFDGADDHVAPRRGVHGFGDAAQREIVSLGAARRHDDFRWIGIHEGSEARPRLVDGRLCPLAKMMHARRVAKHVARNGRQAVENFLRWRGGGVVVKVDTHSVVFSF